MSSELTAEQKRMKLSALGEIATGRLDWVRAQRIQSGYIAAGHRAKMIADSADTLLNLTGRTAEEIYGSDNSPIRELIRHHLRMLWELEAISEDTYRMAS